MNSSITHGSPRHEDERTGSRWAGQAPRFGRMARVTTLPLSRIPDPIDAPAIRWGVLAPGGIAQDWTAALHAATKSPVVAVGSRSLERA